MQEKKLTRREREKLRQRQDMLDGALALFSEKGYHNVSVQEIAERSEFAIGTLYKFFKNKEDLYKSLITGLSQTWNRVMTQALDTQKDPVEKLKAYILAKGELFTQNAPMIRLYLTETRGASYTIMAGMEIEIQEHCEDLLTKLAAVFEKGMDQDRFSRICDPYYLAVSLEHITSAFLFLWMENSKEHPYPENPEFILDILLKGLEKTTPGMSG